MRKGKKSRERVRLKQIDKVERTGPHTWEVEATFCVDDQPAPGHGGRHKVTGHDEVVKGRSYPVRPHEARNPRR
jgi:hypothetical protein